MVRAEAAVVFAITISTAKSVAVTFIAVTSVAVTFVAATFDAAAFVITVGFIDRTEYSGG